MPKIQAMLFFILLFTIAPVQAQIDIPGWSGFVLVDCENLANWSVEHDGLSSGALAVDDGVTGKGLRLDWNIAGGDWVQAKYTFSKPIDLSGSDIFGLSLKGSDGIANRLSVMFADKYGVFYGLNCDDINLISRWMNNLAFPKKLFYHFFTIPNNGQGNKIDWSQIDRFFVVIKRPGAGQGGGSGHLSIDEVRMDRAADWPRQPTFASITADAAAAARAAGYIKSTQVTTGLCTSWKEEPSPKAWLYDQALALIVLTREGQWQSGAAADETALQAEQLADFLVQHQKKEGHWARGWQPDSGVELVDDGWVGDQAWAVLALTEYAAKANDAQAANAAQAAGGWLADKVEADGFITASTEGTVDVWWAMIATGRHDKADLIEQRLVTTLWDNDLKYWLRGYGDHPDPVIAMDAATWVSEFARSSRVNRPDMALAALSFVRRTLVTRAGSGARYGFDGMGPVSVWCEGTAQYVSAGGTDAQFFLDQLLELQRHDGGMPGSTESWPGTCFGWLTTWTGIAPTAWLYFALTQSPFANLLSSRVTLSFPQPPSVIHLRQNYPNPFNQTTVISYMLERSAAIRIELFNAAGKRVAAFEKDLQTPGEHYFRWDGRDERGTPAASGVYLCRLRAKDDERAIKVVLTR